MMKKAHFTDSQIMAILKKADSGVAIPELCREHGMSDSSFYKWRTKYGGMDASLMTRMKELEGQNRRLMLFVLTQRERLRMGSQTCLSYIPRTVTEFTH